MLTYIVGKRKGIGAADPYRYHSEASGVGGVGIGPDHHPAGEGIVLEDYLVDDPGSGLPEVHPVKTRSAPEEFIYLGVDLEG